MSDCRHSLEVKEGQLEPCEGQGQTLLEDAPRIPQVKQDNKTSPSDAHPGQAQEFEAHVESKTLFLDKCRELMNRYDELIQKA